jgi:hypothetical protein
LQDVVRRSLFHDRSLQRGQRARHPRVARTLHGPGDPQRTRRRGARGRPLSGPPALRRGSRSPPRGDLGLRPAPTPRPLAVRFSSPTPSSRCPR